MTTHRSRYRWMALGGLLCLFGVVLMCKIHDGNRAHAQSDSSPPTPSEKAELTPPPAETPEPPRLPALPAATPVTAAEPERPKDPEVKPISATKVLSNVGSGSENRPIVIPAAATVPTETASDSGTPLPPPGTPGVSLPPITSSGMAPPPPAPAATPIITPTPTPPPSVPSAPPAPPAVTDSKILKVGASEMPTDPPGGSTPVRLSPGTSVEEIAPVRPLPTLRARSTPKAKPALPLTGTYLVTLDAGKVLTLPQAILNQLGNCSTVLVSPGSDRCLWLTNQAHLDRLQARLDRSPARESDVRSFKRLYYAQTVKVPVNDSRVAINERLAQFAGLGHEVVLIGIDDHFEVWDAAKWRRYTETKKAKPTAEE